MARKCIYILIPIMFIMCSNGYSYAIEVYEQDEFYQYDDAVADEKDFLNAQLVAEVETLSRKNKYLQEVNKQKKIIFTDIEGEEALYQEIDEMSQAYEQLFNENQKLKKALVSLDDLYKREIEEISPFVEGHEDLKKLTDSQWVVIAEREKIVASLRDEIENLKDHLEVTKNQSEQERDALRVRYKETVGRLNKELLITKEEQKLIVDSYDLLEKRHKLKEEKLELWEQSVSRLIENPNFKNTDTLIAGADDPQDLSIAYAKMAVTHLKQKQYQEAINSYLKAVSCSPKTAVYHYQLGLLYAHLKQNKKAINSFKKYLKLYPDSPNKKRVEKHISLLK